MLSSNVTEADSYGCRHESFRIEWQRLWDVAIKFVRWQHPAMGCGVRFLSGSVSETQTVKLLLLLWKLRSWL